MCIDLIFDDKRLAILIVTIWIVVVVASLSGLNLMHSDFMTVGPSDHTRFMTITIDTWHKWTVLAISTFINTGLADFMGDAVVPWIQNTVQDHKTKFIPYRKFTCYMICQQWAVYCTVMKIFDVSLMMSQIDFLLIRLAADLLTNTFTVYKFMRHKVTDRMRYNLWNEDQLQLIQTPYDSELADMQHEAVQPLTTYKHGPV